jgi:hypothetical protein
MMREVAAHAQVDVGALVHDEEEASHATDLSDIAGEVITVPVPRLRNRVRGSWSLPGSVPLTHVLIDSPALIPALRALVDRRRPDVILAFCSSMARFAFDESLRGVPVVIDMIDADSAKWASLAQVTRPPLRWVYEREARLLARFETVAMRKAFATLVVNEKERAALNDVDPESHVRVLENGVDVRSFSPEGPRSDCRRASLRRHTRGRGRPAAGDRARVRHRVRRQGIRLGAHNFLEVLPPRARLKPLLPLLEEATCTSAVLPNLAREEVLATSV